MPNFDEISQSTSETKLLPVLENGPYWNSIAGFYFDLCVIIDMSFCICLPNFVVIGRSSAELWRHIHFQDGGNKVGNLLPGSGLLTCPFKKVEIYLHTKFRWDSSIHGWDITTSGFEKRTDFILEFYFRFRFRSMYGHWHTILHLPAKFCSNRMIVGRVMTPYPFFKMTAGRHTGFDVGNVRPPTKCNYCRYQIGPQIWSWSDL